MKIKHFAGYGSVNAKKISTKRVVNNYGEMLTEIKVEVWGNHERGLSPYLNDNAFVWLIIKHFGKQYNYSSLSSVERKEWYEKLPNGVDEEHCLYTFAVAEPSLPF